MIMKSNYSQLYRCWNKPTLINKHSEKATHDLANHLKAKNVRVKKLICWSAITLNLNKQNYNVGPDYFFTEKKIFMDQPC